VLLANIQWSCCRTPQNRQACVDMLRNHECSYALPSSMHAIISIVATQTFFCESVLILVDDPWVWVGGWVEKAWVCCNSDGAHHECSEACSGTIASMCCMHIGSSWCDCPFISFLSYILFFYPPLSSSLFFPPLVSSMFLSHYISSIMSSPLFDKLSSTQVSWQAHICNVHIHVG
jgi:hypothetical protein